MTADEPGTAIAVADLPKSTRDYIFRRMKTVKGFLDPVDALMISTILIAQSKAKLKGGVAEIGVYFGRSFLLMAGLLQADERAFAADLFNVGIRSGNDSLQLASFVASGAKLGVPIDRNMIFVGNSHMLNAEAIIKKTGVLRFISIDGDHLLAGVESDAALAKAATADFGVICFDDFCNPEWPEVSLGVFNFLRANESRFSAFALSQKKIFVCQNAYFDLYTSVIRDAPVLRKIHRIKVDLLGRSVIHLRQTYLERIRDESLARTGLGGLNAFFY